MQKLQTLTSEISKAQEDDILSIALTRYREILDEMEPCVLENQTLRKSDFLPVGDYAQYNNGRQDALFQSLPNDQNEFAAEEVIDPDFPQQILGFRN